MSVAKHQACFTTKLIQGRNPATFSHSAVTPIAYLQHTVNTNNTCVKKINAVNNVIKKINCSTALIITRRTSSLIPSSSFQLPSLLRKLLLAQHEERLGEQK